VFKGDLVVHKKISLSKGEQAMALLQKNAYRASYRYDFEQWSLARSVFTALGGR